MIDEWRWPNFTMAELSCKDGAFNMTPFFLGQLQNLRTQFGKPMEPTSACRSAEYNKQIGGHPRSLHVCDHSYHAKQNGCIAIDIAIPDGAYRAELFATAWRLGWSIGWGGKKGFLHLDRRDHIDLPQTTFDY